MTNATRIRLLNERQLIYKHIAKMAKRGIAEAKYNRDAEKLAIERNARRYAVVELHDIANELETLQA